MRMRVVPTKVHGVVDLVTGPTLTAAPNLLRLNDGKGSSLPPRVTGALGTVLSLLTDYETAPVRVVPMKAHLVVDGASGAALASTPWLTGSARNGVRHWLPHAIIGATEIAMALTTRTEPGDRRSRRTAAWVGAGIAVAGAAIGIAVGRRLLSERDD